jgi:hypothetical protein
LCSSIRLTETVVPALAAQSTEKKLPIRWASFHELQELGSEESLR